MCSSRKYLYPHHEGNWKLQRGGGSKAQEIQEGWGVDGRIKFQMVQFDSVQTNSCSCKKIATYQL